ncbi:autophagy protein 5 [Coemansia aciculifera]|uniref:Autophagy protein 5 n=1 Tax=Coemansia aciculifera TaxID=417176 RepID=A0ACC1M503_9FUNG|nr:autophagy protein 5 [Coemansia aciculifera]KAJ2911101.1 autophagy protein 5 [Coemansia aciculifera]
MDYRESEQRAPLKRVWKGMIPIELQLAASDAIELLASAVLPEPFQTFYMLIPRVGYLPFISGKVKERWLDPMLALSGSRVPSDQQIKETDIWFEYKGQALKWHYPIGLLYDMLVSDVHRGDAELPWSLTLHVRKLPTAKIIAQPNGQLMRDMFMAMIKEADFIRNGSTKRVMDLSKNDQMQFLDGLETHSYEKYFAIHSIIVPPTVDSRAPVQSSASSTSSGGQKARGAMQPKAIPVRFYMQTSGSLDDGAKDAPTSGAATTSAGGNGGGGNGLGATKQADIMQFHVSQVPVALYREGSSSELATVADAFKLCYGIADQTNDAFITNCACISHGVCVPWESPISWLADNFFYADCFLHMVVVGI